jgi:periplasmic nitrate reductase NapE
MQTEDDRHRRTETRREAWVFAFLAFVVWPFIAVAVVGGYGFIVWVTQILTGPPGPV